MKRILLITAASLAAIYGLVFLADYLSIRLDIPKRAALDSVEVRRFYAVKLKNKQTNYMFDQPREVDCVNSLLPHFGDDPCWYLKRHTTVQVNLDSGPFGPWIDTP